MKHRGLKFLSLLLTLVMLVGLLPGMSLTAYAEMAISISPAGSGTVTQALDQDGYMECTATPAEGYKFKYWTYTSPTWGPIGVNGNPRSFDPNSVPDLTAHFEQIINVTGVSISPNTRQTLTVGGDPLRLDARVIPDNATNYKVLWGVDQEYATLYADQACTTPVPLGVPTSLLTVYAKATAVGDGVVRVTSDDNHFMFSKCPFEVKAATYTVTFKPGVGSGQDQQLTATAGADFELPTAETWFTAPEGQVFVGWKDDATDTVYKPGDKIQGVDKDYTFTAQWKESSSGGEKKTSGGGSGFDLVFNIPGADNSWEYVGGGYAPQQAYRVSLAPMQGGSAALGLTTGDSGTQMNVYPSTTVYVFPNAEQGYTLDKIVWSLIDGSASYDITEAKNFVMPAMDVVVYVTFKPVG